MGEPRVDGEVIVFPLRANINLKGLTLEQLEERRKRLHLAMAQNLAEELTVEATNKLSECSGSTVISIFVMFCCVPIP